MIKRERYSSSNLILLILLLAGLPLFAQFTWNNVGGTSSTDATVRAVAYDQSTGYVYVGGDFTNVVGTSANYIASWDGSSWSALGTGTDAAVRAIACAGGNVYVGGDFTDAGGSSANYAAMWNGTTWSALGTGTNNTVDAIAINGSTIYFAGQFTTAGGSGANRVASWNGSSWSALGTGTNGRVKAIDVSGSNVYVGGFFTTAGGNSANRIAHWNGSSWVALGTGMDGTVNAVAINGSDVYAGGSFSTAGGSGAAGIATWNGSAWSAMGSGVNSTVNTVLVYLNEVYIGGFFTSSGGNSVVRIAKWNGSVWNGVGTGADNTVFSLAVRGSEGAMYAGGDFGTAGGTTADKVARFTDTDNPLPVSLSSFTVTPGVSEVLLNWVTESETGNDVFLIQRSENGTDFDLIGELDGRGTTSERTTYSYIDRFVSNGNTYYYRLGDRDFNGNITWHHVRSATPSSVGEELDQRDPVASRFDLHHNFPNPFNPETTIRFEIPTVSGKSQDVALRVYDMSGQMVRVLYEGPLSGGVYDMQWNGTDTYGSKVSSGVYLISLRSGHLSKSHKMVLAR